VLVGTEAPADTHIPKKTKPLPPPQYSTPVHPEDVHEQNTRAKELDGFNAGKAPATVTMEDFANESYVHALESLAGADQWVGLVHSGFWQDLSGRMLDAIRNFRQGLAALEEAKGWQGNTHDAAIANLTQSLAEPEAAAQGAYVQGVLENAFSHVMWTTQHFITNVAEAFLDNLAKFPAYRDRIIQEFNSFAQKVLNTIYGPAIKDIAARNPSFSSGQKPNVTDPAANPNGGNTNPNGGNTKAPPWQLPDLSKLGPNGANVKAPNTSGITSNGGGGAPNLDLLKSANGGTGVPNLGGAFPSLLGGGANGPNGASGVGGGFNGAGLTGPLSSATSGLGGAGNGFNGAGLSGPPSSATSGLGGAGGGASGAVNGFNGAGLSGPLSSATSGLGGAANAVKGLNNPAGGGSAADAARQALSAAQKAGEAIPKGGPGFDPKALNALQGAGGGPKAASGTGAGLTPRGGGLGAPPGAPVAAVSPGSDVATSAMTRAGIPSPGGAPAGSAAGASPPPGGGGGQRGPTGKDHKSNKALRGKRNGEDVIGTVDAVVPVLGDDGPTAEDTAASRQGGSTSGRPTRPTWTDGEAARSSGQAWRTEGAPQSVRT
jgi:hypothetical protein